MKVNDEVIIINGHKKHFVGIIKAINGCGVTVELHHKAQEVNTCINDIKLYKRF